LYVETLWKSRSSEHPGTLHGRGACGAGDKVVKMHELSKLSSVFRLGMSWTAEVLACLLKLGGPASIFSQGRSSPKPGEGVVDGPTLDSLSHNLAMEPQNWRRLYLCRRVDRWLD
jgi:hypothetical protein